MTAEIFKMTNSNTKVIEPIIKDNNIHYMHMVLPMGEGLPIHNTNATVYMTVVTGTLTIRLNDEEPITVSEKNILKIPFGVKMEAKNCDKEILELFVVKAPAPKQ